VTRATTTQPAAISAASEKTPNSAMISVAWVTEATSLATLSLISATMVSIIPPIDSVKGSIV